MTKRIEGSKIAEQIANDEKFERKIKSRYEQYMEKINQRPFSKTAYDAGTRAAFAGIPLDPTSPRDYKAGYERGVRMISIGRTDPLEIEKGKTRR